MHLSFVHTPLPGVRFSASIAALSAWIRAQGHAVSLVAVDPSLDDAAAAEAVVAALEAQDPDAVAWSFMTCRWPRVQRLAHGVRARWPSLPMVAGGPHPTTQPQATLDGLPVDAVCVGEGEGPLTHWLAQPGRPHPGLWLRGQAAPGQRWTVADVDALPDWDRALFDRPGQLHNAGNRYEQAVGVAFSRGFCPFTCTFCGVDAYRRVHGQPTRGAMRTRSVRRVLDELHAEVARTAGTAAGAQLDAAGFAVWDEVLPLPRKWITELCAAYGAEIRRPLAVQLRVEQVTDALAESLATAGCDYAVLGLECGDAEYRGRVLDKGFDNAAALAALARLHARGITTFVSFMVGMPWERKAHLAATVRLARDVVAAGGDRVELSWKYFTPERGTRLFPLLEAQDLLIERYVDHPFGASEAMIRMTHCTQRDLDVASQALEQLRGSVPRDTFARAPGP